MDCRHVAMQLDTLVRASFEEEHAALPFQRSRDEGSTREVVVRWGDRMPLVDYLAAPPKAHKDEQGQWLYRFYLTGDGRPLYVGKAGPREDGVWGRIRAHRNTAAQLARTLPAAQQVSTPLGAKDAARRHRMSPLAALQGDSELFHRLLASLGVGKFDITIGEVLQKWTGADGKPQLVRPRRGTNLTAERRAIFSGHARINRPDRGDESLLP